LGKLEKSKGRALRAEAKEGGDVCERHGGNQRLGGNASLEKREICYPEEKGLMKGRGRSCQKRSKKEQAEEENACLWKEGGSVGTRGVAPQTSLTRNVEYDQRRMTAGRGDKIRDHGKTKSFRHIDTEKFTD